MVPRDFLGASYYLLLASGWLLLHGDFVGASKWLLLIVGGFWEVALNY